MTTFETDVLAELIGRKHECLTQLRDLGLRQDALIASDDMSRLLQLLGVKQRLLGELQEIERGLDPFRQQDPEARQWRSPAARESCAQALRGCESLLAEIVAHEKQSETELRRRRDETAAQLEGFHATSRTRGAYAAGGKTDSAHLDLSSEG